MPKLPKKKVLNTLSEIKAKIREEKADAEVDPKESTVEIVESDDQSEMSQSSEESENVERGISDSVKEAENESKEITVASSVLADGLKDSTSISDTNRTESPNDSSSSIENENVKSDERDSSQGVEEENDSEKSFNGAKLRKKSPDSILDANKRISRSFIVQSEAPLVDFSISNLSLGEFADTDEDSEQLSDKEENEQVPVDVLPTEEVPLVNSKSFNLPLKNVNDSTSTGHFIPGQVLNENEVSESRFQKNVQTFRVDGEPVKLGVHRKRKDAKLINIDDYSIPWLHDVENYKFTGKIFKLSKYNVWNERWILISHKHFICFHGKEYSKKKMKIGDLEFVKFCLKPKFQLQLDEYFFTPNDIKSKAKFQEGHFHFSLRKGKETKYFKCASNTDFTKWSYLIQKTQVPTVF